MSINRVFLAWNSLYYSQLHFLFNETKVSIVNWLKWPYKLQHLFRGTLYNQWDYKKHTAPLTFSLDIRPTDFWPNDTVSKCQEGVGQAQARPGRLNPSPNRPIVSTVFAPVESLQSQSVSLNRSDQGTLIELSTVDLLIKIKVRDKEYFLCKIVLI